MNNEYLLKGKIVYYYEKYIDIIKIEDKIPKRIREFTQISYHKSLIKGRGHGAQLLPNNKIILFRMNLGKKAELYDIETGKLTRSKGDMSFSLENK